MNKRITAIILIYLVLAAGLFTAGCSGKASRQSSGEPGQIKENNILVTENIDSGKINIEVIRTALTI